MERRIHYLFVDLGCLRDRYRIFAERWFRGEGGMDFNAIHRQAHGPPKTFYYDCGGQDGPDETARGDQGGYHDRIRSVPGTHVRAGDREGSAEARQRAVAVQLAVDMLLHATRGKMTHATLLSGNPDFAPVVRALVEIGTDVTVWAEPETIAPSLRFAADNFLPLRWQDYHRWTEERIGATARLPGIGASVASKLEGSRESHARGGWTLLESGTIGEARHRADLWEMETPEATQYSLAIEQGDGPEASNVLTVTHSDRALLLRYADIEWGGVSLAPVQR